MKKNLLSLLFLATLQLSAQIWSPTGATWYYRLDSYSQYAYYMGHLKMQVTGTLTVNGKTCQSMLGTFKGSDQPPGNNLVTKPLITVISYENNRVIYRYDSTSASFDTIVNFNAKIGDKWRSAAYPIGSCPLSRIPLTVIDTDHVVINAVSLKRITLSAPNNRISMTATADTVHIVERMLDVDGFLFVYPQCGVGKPPVGVFKCYSDNSFPEYNPTSAICAFIVGIKENKPGDVSINIYPNPADELLSIEVPDTKTYSFRMIDPLGRSWPLAVTSNKNSVIQVDLSIFNPGVYFLEVSANGKALGVEKIIKH